MSKIATLIFLFLVYRLQALNNCEVALGSQSFQGICLALFKNSTLTKCIQLPDGTNGGFDIDSWIFGVSIDPLTLDLYGLFSPGSDISRLNNRHLYKIPLIELLDFDINNIDSLNDINDFRDPNTINWNSMEYIADFTNTIYPNNLVHTGCIKNNSLFDESQLFVMAGTGFDIDANHIYQIITNDDINTTDGLERLILFESYNVRSQNDFGRPLTYSPYDNKFYIFIENEDGITFNITQIDPITGINTVTNIVTNIVDNEFQPFRNWKSIEAIDDKTLIGYWVLNSWYLLNIYSFDNEQDPYIGTQFTHDEVGKGLVCFDTLIKKRESCIGMLYKLFIKLFNL